MVCVTIMVFGFQTDWGPVSRLKSNIRTGVPSDKTYTTLVLSLKISPKTERQQLLFVIALCVLLFTASDYTIGIGGSREGLGAVDPGTHLWAKYQTGKSLFLHNIYNFILVIFLFTMFCNFRFELRLGIFWFFLNRKK